MLLDVLRGWFVIAMIVFHLAWDLTAFGFVSRGMVYQTGWQWFGNVILSGFLLISGFSLFWGWRFRFEWRSAMRRFCKIAVAAVVITIITYLVTPRSFVYFGVLHHIALGSLILALVRKLPLAVLAVLAIGSGALPDLFEVPALNGPWGWWIGLSPSYPPSNDAVPLLPWFCFMLAGGILGRWIKRGTARRIGSMGEGTGWGTAFGWIGKHSFLIYLFHQPVLWGILFLLSRLS